MLIFRVLQQREPHLLFLQIPFVIPSDEFGGVLEHPWLADIVDVE